MTTVLIIEDKPDDLAEARRLLLAGSDRRYTFREALSGAEGVAIARSAEPPDIVILDDELPDMNALEVLAALAGPHGLTVCPVLVLTGATSSENGPRLLRAGAQDYIGRGWMTPGSMTRALENSVERYRLTRELRAADERMRLAAEMSGLGWFERDFVTGRSHGSPGLERILGLEPGACSGGVEDSLAMIHPDDRERVMAAVDRARNGAGPFHAEMRIRRPDGTEAWIDSRALVERDAGGRPLRVLGVALDITQRRRAEAALGQSHKMGAVGRLAGGIAHSFNNMMTIILGNLDELPPVGPEDPAHEALQDMREAGERASRLTRQLLAFARRQRLSPTAIALDATVAELASMLSLAVGANVKVHTRLDPCRAVADPSAIEQVIVNLALNAKDAMPKGGSLTFTTAPVTIGPDHAHPAARPGAYAMVAVADTGCGMDAATLAQVFEPFFTSKACGDSAGLGLSTAERIISQSGGWIEAESAPGRGSTFRFYLPLS